MVELDTAESDDRNYGKDTAVEIDGFETGNCDPGPKRRLRRIVAFRISAYERPLTPDERHERHERIERYARRAAAKLPLMDQPAAEIEGQA